MTKSRYSETAVGLLLACAAGGCAHYYRVTDPASGKIYHTQKIDRGRGGQVGFKDAKSGASVTLQSSEVTEITKYEYQRDTLDENK